MISLRWRATTLSRTLYWSVETRTCDARSRRPRITAYGSTCGESKAAAPEYNQSQSLIAEADRRWIIPGDWVKRFVRLREDAAPLPPVGVLVGLEDLPVPKAAGKLTPKPHVVDIPVPTSPAATPADLARLAAAFGRDSAMQPRPASTGRGWEARFVEHEDLPRLRDLSSARQAWEDNEQDAIETTSNPVDVGERFGRR